MIERIKGYLRMLLMAAMFITMAASCDVFEYPAPLEEPTPDPTVLSIHLTHDVEMDYLMSMEYGVSAKPSRGTRLVNYEVRYTVNLYPLESKADFRTSRDPCKTLTYIRSVDDPLDCTFTFNVDPGIYNVMVWTDYVEAGTGGADHFYRVGDFAAIDLNPRHKHEGCNDRRDAFRGSTLLQAVPHTTTHTAVFMERPMAKYRFIANDLKAFTETLVRERMGIPASDSANAPGAAAPSIDIDPDDYRVVMRYTGYMTSEFNMFIDIPSDSRTGVFYEGSMSKISDEEMELGYDYVLVPGDHDTSVNVVVEVYDRSGRQMASSSTVTVPLRRGHLTEVRGAFLTSSAGSSTTINAEYEGEYNIEIR